MRSAHKKARSLSRSNTKQLSSRGWIGSFVIGAAFVVIGVLAILNRQLIADSVQYYQYQPTDRIAAFVTDTGMNGSGKFLFYASQPALEDAAAFNAACQRREATAAVLGCYDGQKIFIYDVTDERLAGIRAATAVHEMLHAAYVRLDSSDQQRVDKLLEAEYERLKTDSAFADRMAFYERNEPGERFNELHSIIGTEIGNISTELETYYRRYFSDRSKVVALHEQYSAVFEELKEQAADLNRQLDAINQSIQADSARYNEEVAAVQMAISDFNRRAREGDFSGQAAFSAERTQLVARTVALEELHDQINVSVKRYNDLVVELNSIATETNELTRSLDSTLAPPPSL